VGYGQLRSLHWLSWMNGISTFLCSMRTMVTGKGFSGGGQLGVLLGLAGAGMLMASLAALFIWKLGTGQPMGDMAEGMTNPANAEVLKALQVVNTFFVFLLPAFSFAYICYHQHLAALGFGEKIRWKPLLYLLLIVLFSGPLIDGLVRLNEAIPLPHHLKLIFDGLESRYEKQIALLVQTENPAQFATSLILVALLPAFFEEVFFRGALQNMLVRWWRKHWLALVATSVLFSAIHASWYLFIPRFALGLLLGGLLLITENIWYSIIMHFANNALVVCFLYVQHLEGKSASVVQEPSYPGWMAPIAAVAIFLLFAWLRKDQLKQIPREAFLETNPRMQERNNVG
jgi:hypothetical protein